MDRDEDGDKDEKDLLGDQKETDVEREASRNKAHHQQLDFVPLPRQAQGTVWKWERISEMMRIRHEKAKEKSTEQEESRYKPGQMQEKYLLPNSGDEKQKSKSKLIDHLQPVTDPLRAGLPWIEKYRPVTLQDVVGHQAVMTSLQALIRNKQIELPHLLLCGPPGNGKTSTILAIAREIKASTLLLNASDDRGRIFTLFLERHTPLLEPQHTLFPER